MADRATRRADCVALDACTGGPDVWPGRDFHQITSGRRALVAAYVRDVSALPVLYASAWADACAALVELGWPTACRSLLAWTLDPAIAERAARVLQGGTPPSVADIARRRHRELGDFREVSKRPAWATFGVQAAGETSFLRPTLDLETAEVTDALEWPPMTVAVYQAVPDPICVLVEVGASGPPTRFTPAQARRLSSALAHAAAVVESVR